MVIHRFYCEEITEPAVELGGAEFRHLNSVLRLRAGDKLELFDGAGALAEAMISDVGKRKAVLRVENIEREPERSAGRIIIAVSIAKGQRFDWLIEKCTELGVDRICPVIFERTVKQAGNPKAGQRWRNITIAAAKQCRRLFLPVIDSPTTLTEAIETIKAEYPHCRMLAGSMNKEAAGLAAPMGAAEVLVVPVAAAGLVAPMAAALAACLAASEGEASEVVTLEVAAGEEEGTQAVTRAALAPEVQPASTAVSPRVAPVFSGAAGLVASLT